MHTVIIMTNIKPCRMCGLNKDHYDSVPTGCRDCYKARVRENRLANVEYYRKYDRERNKEPHRKEMFIVKQRRMRKEKGPDYMAAHNAVARAVKSGKLIRPLRCERCHVKEKIDAHHDDHSKKLNVMWLCPVCHAQRHKELNKLWPPSTK